MNDWQKARIAAVTETFLETNNSHLAMTDDEIVKLFLDIASSLITREQVEQLLREKVHSKS